MKDVFNTHDGHEHLDEEFEVQRVELIDDEGETSTFIIDDWFDFEGKLYAVLVSELDDEDAILFRVEESGEEMNFLTPDEEEFEKVSAYYETMEE